MRRVFAVLVACWLPALGCRLNYETLDVSAQPSTGANAGVSTGSGGTDSGGTDSGGTDSGGSSGVATGGEPIIGVGGDSGIEPSAGAPNAVGGAPGGECATADECSSGTCVRGFCEDTGLGSGTVVTFGHSDSDYNDVAADTWIADWSPDASYENGGSLTVEQSATGTAVSLIRFDLSAMPAGVTITGAQLRVDVFMDTSPTGNITVHEQIEPRTDWETTWNERGLGVPWTVPGCGVGSRSTDVLGLFSPTQNQVYDIPLAPSVVQRWVDDPSRNHGFVLVGHDLDHVDFRPAGVGTGVKPQLSITYE